MCRAATETEITKRVGAGWRNWKKCSTVRQKDASETEGECIQNSDQASNDIMGQKRGLQRRDKKNGLR